MKHAAEIDFEVMVDKFYEVLFAEIPGVKSLFRDRHRQKTMMIIALKSIGEKARGNSQLPDYLKMLGEKHKMFGLSKIHIRAGQTAFEQAIEVGGRGLSVEEKQHYLDAYAGLERAMGFAVEIPKEKAR